MRHWLLAGAAMALLTLPACNTSHTVKVEPVEIKPIYITLDVYIKVEREVEDFFSAVEERAAEVSADDKGAPASGDEK
jgi:hypothetical protein